MSHRAEFVEFWTKDDGSTLCITCEPNILIENNIHEAEHLVRYHGWRRREDGIVEYPEEDLYDP